VRRVTELLDTAREGSRASSHGGLRRRLGKAICLSLEQATDILRRSPAAVYDGHGDIFKNLP